MRRLALTLAVFFAFALAACSKAPLHHQEAYVFGTRVEILIAAAGEAQARPAAAAVLREFDRLHRRYHAWQPSELSALNAALAEGKTFDASAELAALIEEAKRLSAQSGGLFDPGIGRLIALWGFQSEDFKGPPPDAGKIAAWRENRPGIADLELDGRRVSARRADVALDFGGYLKGVALDRAAAILRAQGITNALVNIGGNVIALGSKNGTPWRVGVQHPRAPGPLATLELRAGEAIGTSGDYQRYFESAGRRYSHLLDPASGEPATKTQALTVLVTPREQAGTLSDAATKPLFIAGENWPPVAQRMAIEHVLRVDGEGRVEASAVFFGRLEFTGVDANSVKIIR